MSSLPWSLLVRFDYRNPKIPEMNGKDWSKDLCMLTLHKSVQPYWRHPHMLKELTSVIAEPLMIVLKRPW